MADDSTPKPGSIEDLRQRRAAYQAPAKLIADRLAAHTTLLGGQAQAAEKILREALSAAHSNPHAARILSLREPGLLEAAQRQHTELSQHAKAEAASPSPANYWERKRGAELRQDQKMNTGTRMTM